MEATNQRFTSGHCLGTTKSSKQIKVCKKNLRNCAEWMIVSLVSYSKSKGQILKLAAVFNALFSLEPSHPLNDQLSDISVKAAINFIETCNEHTAIIGGRKTLTEPCHVSIFMTDSVYARTANYKSLHACSLFFTKPKQPEKRRRYSILPKKPRQLYIHQPFCSLG